MGMPFLSDDPNARVLQYTIVGAVVLMLGLPWILKKV